MDYKELESRIADLQRKIDFLREMQGNEEISDPESVMKKNMLPEAYMLWQNPNVLTDEQRTAIKELPWKTINCPQEETDLKKAKMVLDEGHYGMNEVKQQILQLLAVRKRTGNSGKGILLVGAPGTGKTTIAKAIARVMNVGFYKISCQGIISQWELLGSSVGWRNARQGYIVDAIQRSGSFNSVICLDEVDKFENIDGRNPQMSLLSVLDSTNNMFVDNFIQAPLDLSNITFILTANSIDAISPILRDRVDVIHIDGYSSSEKRTILKEYIIPKLYDEYKVDKKEIQFNQSAIDVIVNDSTMPGIRDIKKNADNLFRKAIYLLDLGAKTIPINEGFVRSNVVVKPVKKKKEIGFRI